MLQIIKKSKGKFSIFEKDVRGSSIDLDFNPFIEEERLTHGLIFHLRARPPQNANYWTYGFYDLAKDEYISAKEVKFNNVSLTSLCWPWLSSKPTHVLIIKNAELRCDRANRLVEVFNPSSNNKKDSVVN